ncbi:zinc-binding protein A33-like isoform X2 [Scyliorhinus torazame]|uniref:zinc-binding protein A33-like isoform X2 n=1 Tax=Scyliorhinus torazame TaxID=75743 RepID=UPI003B58E4EE
MAAIKQVLSLTEELTCSICLSLFEEPVQLDCDHNFCKSCIQKCWENQSGRFSCPECRAVSPQRSYKSSRVLANLCEKARQLELTLEPEAVVSQCEEHGEKLKLFCEDDHTLICVICRDTPAHSQHSFLPVADAVRKYKELTGSLEQHISEQFARIHQYLQDKETHLTEELRIQHDQDFQSMKDNLAAIDEELNSLKEDISNLQAVIHQDSIIFLKEMKRLPERCLVDEENGNEGDEGSEEDDDDVDDDDEDESEGSDEECECGSEEDDEEIVGFSILTLGMFRGPLLYATWKRMKEIITPVPAPLTFDPNTAHRKLILSDGLTSVKPRGKKVSLFKKSKKFDECLCVLGSEGFTSGTHYWEVEVGDISDWIVGVATESTNRKGEINLLPENGYWILSLTDGDEYAGDKFLKLSVKPTTIGVYLDYEQGQLSFYNADDMSHVTTYTDTFTEKLFPYFVLDPSDRDQNSEPLKLHHLAI